MKGGIFPMRKLSSILLVLVGFAVITMIAGCGGSGPTTVTPEAPPAFIPTTHDGYAAYLINGGYDGGYIPQDSADHFTVQPGAYLAVAVKQAEMGTMGAKAKGGIPWESSFVYFGTEEAVSPTPSGWVFGPGKYQGTIPYPGGNDITIVVDVVAAPVLNGLTLNMVPVNGLGYAYPKDANGVYQIEVWMPFQWKAIWMRGDAVVNAPAGIDAYAGVIYGNDSLRWSSEGQMGTVVTRAAFAVSVSQMADGGMVTTVDTVMIQFTPEITTGPGLGSAN